MDILPILATLRRHKTAATLIVLEIALSCAIICNALFLIGSRLARMDRPSGLAEDEIVRISITGIAKDENPEVLTKVDLESLRALPGVKTATATNQMPYGNSSWNSSLNLDPDQTHQTLNSTMYFGEEQLLETFGLEIVAGRDFNPDEYVDWKVLEAQSKDDAPPPVIITRTMAQKLFPGQNAVGKRIYIMGDQGSTIVGIVDHLLRPNEWSGPDAVEYASIFPVRMPYTVGGGNYLIRVDDPSRRAEVIEAAVATLEKNNPNRIILEKKTFEEMRAEYYQKDRAMAWLLILVCIALLVVTALGIVGLASFWVQQRTRHIGIRRALGATRTQILRYFQTENFLLATFGIVLGMVLAYGVNLWLMDKYELPRLPAYFLPFGAAALWILGQIAVLGPALRAAAVPPAVATRNL